jgi:hypothetical protein
VKLLQEWNEITNPACDFAMGLIQWNVLLFVTCAHPLPLPTQGGSQSARIAAIVFQPFIH